MIISEIKQQKKHLVKVSFSNGEFCLLDKEIFSQYVLNVGDNLSPDKLSELKSVSDYERAKSRALWFLDRADQTEKGLFDKLKRAALCDSACNKAIARLKELGLVDDRRYAQNFTERCIEANMSKRAIYVKLLSKGVPSDIAKSVLDSAETDEVSAIKALLQKKYRSKLDNKDNVQKVYAALIRKGFSYAAVRDTLKSYCEELSYEEF